MHVEKGPRPILMLSSPMWLCEKATVLTEVDNEKYFLTFLVASFLPDSVLWCCLDINFSKYSGKLLCVVFIPLSNLWEYSFENN